MVNFQQFLPVGDNPPYEESGDSNILFESIYYVVQTVESHRHCQDEYDNDPEQTYFQRCLINFQQGTLYEQDWQTLQSRFMQTADDTSNLPWENFPHIVSTKRLVLSITWTRWWHLVHHLLN